MRISKPKYFWQILVIAVLLIAIRFYPAILWGNVLVFGDNYSLQVPGKIYTSSWLKNGVIPWWNPTIFAGIPWAAEVSQTVFYPSTLFFTLFNPDVAINATVALHLLFTFIGMFLLGHIWTKNNLASLIGAVLWTFSTQTTGSINNIVTIQSIAWFPWISYWALRLFEKRVPFIFALFVLGQFLGGYPQHVVYGIFLAIVLNGLYFWKKITLRKWLTTWILTGILTLLISAIAWVPFIEIFLNSSRTIQTLDQAGVGSLNPMMLIKMVLPYFFDNPAAGMKWGPAWSGFPNVLFYFTWFGLLLIIRAIRNRRSLALTIFSMLTIIIALGDNFFVFPLMQKLIPFFKVSRGPSIILGCTNIALSLIVARELVDIGKFRVRKIEIAIALFLVTVSTAAMIILPKNFESLWTTADNLIDHRLSQSAFHTLDRDYKITRNILINISINAFLLLLVLFAIKKRRFILITALLGIDMIFNTQGMLFFGPSKVYPSWENISKAISMRAPNLADPNYRTLTRNMNSPYTDFGMYWEAMTVRKPFSDSFVDQKELQSARYLQQIRDSYTPDWNMVYQIPVIHGYTTLLPKDFAAMWEIDDSPGINAIDKVDLQSNLLRQWAVGNYIVDKQFEIKESLPESKSTGLSSTVDLYTLPALTRFRYEDDSPVDIFTLTETPNKLILSINSQGRASAIIADRFDNNWKLKINGREEVINNYQGMRTFRLVPGLNLVEMEYIPKWFFVGLATTVISAMVTLLIISKNHKIKK